MPQSADPHLLLGLLALQAGLVRGDQLVAAFRAWRADDSRPIGDHLVAMGCLDDAQRASLAAQVGFHARPRGDPLGGLASIPTDEPDRARPAAPTEADPDRTRSCPGSTSSGPAAGLGQTSGTLRYRILRPHAEGGLGAVYVALDSELNREVALKQILEDHADDPGSRGRFLVEAEITGGLEHPGVVPVYGLGRHSDGRPYYAMRLVRGDSFRDAIEAFHKGPKSGPDGSLEFRRLLRKFTDVCNTIEYAHSRGVLHRDIKPGNVIVGKHGETLVVDWGLAKATGVSDPSSPEPSLVPASGDCGSTTLPGRALGTPAYMSPEQARGDLDDLGPRSDVYSLGATLYFVVTGRAAFKGSVSEMLDAVRAGDFPPPRAIDPSIDPALEAIVLKAMAADPASRHASAKALADDVERWLADERVEAYAEPWTRTLIRWLTRHRVSVTAAGVAGLVALAALGVLAAVQSAANARLAETNHALDLQRRRAEANESEAIEAVKRFTDAIVDNPELKNNPELGPLRKTLLEEPRAFFGRLRERLQSEADPRPESLSRLARAANSHAMLVDQIGDKQDAIRTFQEAVEILERLNQGRPAVAEHRADLAWGLFHLGKLLRETGRSDEARAAYGRAIEIGERLTSEHPEAPGYRAVLVEGCINLGILLATTGPVDEARRSFRRAIGIGEALASEHPEVADYRDFLAKAHANFGILLTETGRTDEALQAFGRAIELNERLARDDPAGDWYQAELARVRNNFGLALQAAGRLDQARQTFERAIETLDRLAREQPAQAVHQSYLAKSCSNLGLLLHGEGRADEALEAFRRGIEINERLARDHPSVVEYRADLAKGRVNLGWQQRDAGRIDEARRSFEGAIEIAERLVGENPHVVDYQATLAKGRFSLATLLSVSGRLDEARAAYGRAIEIAERLARDHPSVVEYQTSLAGCHTNIGTLHNQVGRIDEARASWERAEAIYRRLAREQPDVPAYASALGVVLNNAGVCELRSSRFAKARERLLEAGSWHQKALGASPNTPEFLEYRERQLHLLIHAEQGLGDEEGVERAQRELADFRRNDPRSAALDARLKRVMEGETPKDAAERLALAPRAYGAGRFALAARLWGEALDAQPGVAEDRQAQHAYNAACAAALAADGKGTDPPADEAEKAQLRGRALGWLKFEADVWSKHIDSVPPEARKEITAVFRHWQGDPDVAGVRDPDSLARLPEGEQAAWKALWIRVGELIQKAE